jgi:N-acetylmuramic acid 6-phosphate etherase
VPSGGRPAWVEHLLLKLLLNAHSTLVMGRLGRYERNLMTWVRPSNNKLIDRAIRYIDLLLQQRGITRSYEDLAVECFVSMASTKADGSVVLETVRRIAGR